jgi:23S rRNA pseudouridine1911/1915/1917 synthase
MPQIKILYEDNDLLAVEKESGVVVNRSKTYSMVTLQDLMYKKVFNEVEPPKLGPSKNIDGGGEDSVDDESFSEGNEFYLRAGIVHRLDKDTSGVLLVAKNEVVFKNLQQQFKRRYVQKEYSAVIFGKLPEEYVEINAPLKRDPSNKFKYAVVLGGKEAFTRFEKSREAVVEGQQISIINAYPKTGRTHQIRVHLAAINCAIIGDDIYGTRQQAKFSDQYFGRLMLHAKKITFMHPISGKTLEVVSPLPEIFLKHFN